MRDDFIFDGRLASEFGLAIVNFNGSSDTENNVISETNFTTFKPASEDRYIFTASEYTGVLTKTIQVIKFENCEYKTMTKIDIENIQRWLCREDGYHSFCFITDDEETFEYNAKIDMKVVEIVGKNVGLELTITTNSPYAYKTNVKKYKFNGQDSLIINDNSSKIGTSPINITIACIDSGDLEIEHIFNNQSDKIIIANCIQGEIITITEYQTIESNLPTHKIANDFNFVFPTISNLIINGRDETKNIYKCNMNCEVTFKIHTRRKVGI